MDEKFRISSSMTKKEIIDTHTELLEAFKQKAKEAETARKAASEAEKHQNILAAESAKDATIESVIRNIGNLRIQIGETLNDLTEKMNKQADKLQALNSAIDIQEKRLSELYDIESASDSLAKLIQAYEERKENMEKEYFDREKELDKKHSEKMLSMENEYSQKLKNLKDEIDNIRQLWIEEKNLEKKQREREEAEYVYERDRNRKIDEDKYQEKKSALEKELNNLKENSEKELSEREKAIKERETEFDTLKNQVAEFPNRIEQERKSIENEVTSRITTEFENKLQSNQLERKWESKISEEKIKHLESIISSQNSKIDELKQELGKAYNQVEQIAYKTVEGASLNKAFQSVNEIALEQARKPERKDQN